MAHGPANKKKLPLSVCLICGMFFKFICVDFEVAKIKRKTFPTAVEKVTYVTDNKIVFIYLLLEIF